MTHAVSTNGQYRFAVERVGNDIVVSMQDPFGRKMVAKFTTPELASIASEPDDDFFPEHYPLYGYTMGHQASSCRECMSLIGSNFEVPRAD